MGQHTISSIAEEKQVSRRTVQVWMKKAIEKHGDIGSWVNSTRVFDDMGRAKLLEFASPSKPVKEPEPIAVQVVQSDHRVIQDAPIVPTSYDLGRFRSPEECVVVENPLDVVDQVRAIVGTLKGSMQVELQQRQRQLNETQQAIAALTEQEQILRDEALTYRIKSDIATQQQTQATSYLQAQVGKLQAIAAPPDGG